MNTWAPRVAVEPAKGAMAEEENAPVWKAWMPPLPVALIFLLLPGLFFDGLPGAFAEGLPVPYAMLAATMVVLLLNRREVAGTVKRFRGYRAGLRAGDFADRDGELFIAGISAVGARGPAREICGDEWVGAKVAASSSRTARGHHSSGHGAERSSKAGLPGLRGADATGVDLGVLVRSPAIRADAVRRWPAGVDLLRAG